jgi:hypothetical protein
MPQRYYTMMSHYYLEYPEKAEEVLSSCLHLWNSLHMPLLFALLFHEYVRIFIERNWLIKLISESSNGLLTVYYLQHSCG